MRVAVVGGLTIDRIILPDGTTKNRMGGGGYYCSVVARLFDNEVILQTIVGDDFPREWLYQLESIGVKVVPEFSDRSLKFVNEYFTQGFRRQMVLSRPSRGLSRLDDEVVEAELVQITPVFGELEESIVPQLKKIYTSLEVQGFIRVSENTRVKRKFWKDRDTWLSKTRFLSLSMDELHCVIKKTVFELLDDFSIETVSLTNGAAGAFIFSREGAYLIPAYHVKEIDPTGCGDAFSITLSLFRAHGRSLLDSALFAASTSSFIAERGGLENLPSIPEMESRADYLKGMVRRAQLNQ